MSNQATPANASVISATCSDDRHPGSCVLDGSDKTFWFTTGMFPQELVIAFNGEVVPANVNITSRHGQRGRANDTGGTSRRRELADGVRLGRGWSLAES